MNIKQAKEEIIHTVRAYLSKDENGTYQISAVHQRPILLMGPPGIGKTQIMEQIAIECHIALVAYTITHHTRQSAIGLPFIREKTYQGRSYSITEYTMSEIIASIYKKMEDSGLCEGILFIDEINCVSETLAPTMLQFLQCKTFGNQAVPEGWIIVAAGNPPEYNRSVRDFDVVTLDRVRYIDLEADLSVWKEYARNSQVHSAILSYLELRPQNFYRIGSTVDGLQFVTARGWEDLSFLIKLYEKLHIPVTEAIVYEFIHHEDVAQDVAAYLDLYWKYQDDYGIPEILAGRIKPQIFARIEHAAFDERLSVVNLLSDGIDRYFRLVEREKNRTDIWYSFLKDFRSRLSDAKEPNACYTRLLQDFREDFQRKQSGALLDRTRSDDHRWLIGRLEQAIPPKGQIPQEAFSHARSGFDLQQEKLSEAELAAEIALEYAFDFMEQALPDSQEMVIFVTNLTLNKEAVLFLSEHPCERYIKYNQQLLIGTRKQQLLSELSEKSESSI